MRFPAMLLAIAMLSAPPLMSQALLFENFDASTQIPAGWSVWNRQPFPIDPETNWTVRDTGTVPPGIGNNRTKARSAPRAVGVSWWASIDTTGAPSSVADAWLVTRRVQNIRAGDVVRFWASGGSPTFLDSLQVWVSNVDSTTTGMISGRYLGSVIWPVGSVFGRFTEHAFPLTEETGYDVWIGFRYYMDCSINGFYVHVDDVRVEPLTSVAQEEPVIPHGLTLYPNYPNPFNPATTVRFAVPGLAGAHTDRSRVTLRVFDVTGRAVSTLLDEPRAPGVYTLRFDASDLPSGTYFLRLTAGGVSATRPILLLR